MAQQEIEGPPRILAPQPRRNFALVPRELVDGPEVAPLEEPVKPNAVEAPGAPAERATFGTAVEFVRNTFEASRIARQERKLVFHLHVSGNFEQEAFT
jgi:hypothetical protein